MPPTCRPVLRFPISVRRLQVLRVVDLGPGMRRLTLGGEQLRAFTTDDGVAVPALRNDGFDDHVKVFVPEVGGELVPARQVEGHLDWDGASPAKDYTPRRWDPVTGEIDLDVVRHPGGCASTWAESVAVGDEAHIAGPKSSSLLPEDVGWYLVAGDETALPAIGRLLEELPVDARAQIFVEVADAAHELELPGLAQRAGVEVTWLHRDGVAPGHSDVLERAVRAADWWDGEVYVWVAGEAVTVKPLRHHLRHERQVPRDHLEVTGYWRRTEVAPAPTAPSAPAPAEQDDDGPEPYERLEALLSLTAPVALRAAVALGVLQRLDRSPASSVELAGALGLHERTLRPLLQYLAAVGVLAVDGHEFSLGELGELLAEDDDDLADLDPAGAGTLLDLSVPALVAAVRDGGPGGDVRERLAADASLAQAFREHRGRGAAWSSPSVVGHVDWTRHAAVAVMGAGAPETAATLVQEVPGLTVTVCTDAGPPPGAGTVLAVHLLDALGDDDAATLLRGLSRSHPDAVLLLAETVAEEEDVHDHDAELDLQLRVALGGGVRTAQEMRDVVTGAGWLVRGEQDLGWDMRLLTCVGVPTGRGGTVTRQVGGSQAPGSG